MCTGPRVVITEHQCPVEGKSHESHYQHDLCFWIMCLYLSKFTWTHLSPSVFPQKQAHRTRQEMKLMVKVRNRGGDNICSVLKQAADASTLSLLFSGQESTAGRQLLSIIWHEVNHNNLKWTGSVPALRVSGMAGRHSETPKSPDIIQCQLSLSINFQPVMTCTVHPQMGPVLIWSRPAYFIGMV